MKTTQMRETTKKIKIYQLKDDTSGCYDRAYDDELFDPAEYRCVYKNDHFSAYSSGNFYEDILDGLEMVFVTMRAQPADFKGNRSLHISDVVTIENRAFYYAGINTWISLGEVNMEEAE